MTTPNPQGGPGQNPHGPAPVRRVGRPAQARPAASGFRQVPPAQAQPAAQPPAVRPQQPAPAPQPQYTQPQYTQPQHAQPQYQQPQYGQETQYQQPQYGQGPETPYGSTPMQQVNVNVQAPMGPPKSKATAALLAFFLGGFGAHNFYLGYSLRGGLQLGLWVFSLVTILFGIGALGIFALGIWVFIEFILILMGSGGYETDAFGRPLV
ncbi:TM2 domain-containing protein [Corynebacterium sphenisci]|nr:TM2 domain-containing protein [Corynebacterium sphenisci]